MPLQTASSAVPHRAKEILALCGSGQLASSDAVPAFCQLEKAVQGQHSLATTTRSDPAFEVLISALQPQLPSLRGKAVSNTWLGVQDLRVSESRAPRHVRFVKDLCKVTKEQAESLDAQATANTLNCMAKLNHSPGQEVLKMLCEGASKNAKAFNAQKHERKVHAMTAARARLQHARNASETLACIRTKWICTQYYRHASYLHSC
eukprot:g7654.t1